MHNDFTLFPRVVPSGKMVVYYYAYDGGGRRLGPWSTGQVNKTAARNYCNSLNRKGKLLPQDKEIPSFAEYAVGFWDWEKSEYVKDRRKRRALTQRYTHSSKNVAENTLVPYFGKMKLDKITGEVIEEWLSHMIQEKYKNSTTNSYFVTLKTMLRWAVKKRLIERDPFNDVQKLLDDSIDREIITPDEFKALFCGDWRQVWDNDLLRCTANKLAALTGMRISEVLGLRGEYVFDDHIYLCAQYDRKYGYRDTKTKKTHHIPLTHEVIAELKALMKVNGQRYVFSHDGGATPVEYRLISGGLKMALKNIGLTDIEIKRRGLTLHAWRHFCNTEMQKGGLTVPQVQAVTGHKSKRSTERYTHFNALDFGEASKIQEELLKPKKEKKKPAFTLVRTPEEEKQTVRHEIA